MSAALFETLIHEAEHVFERDSVRTDAGAGERSNRVCRNPATGRPIASVTFCDEIDYSVILDAARRIQPRWRNSPPARKAERLRAIAAAVAARKEALSALLTAEVGLMPAEAATEVRLVIETALLAATLAEGQDERTAPLDAGGAGDYLRRHPLGTVAAITNFNAPLSAWAKTALIAAACGNTVIWKPSCSASLCAIALHRLVQGVMEPDWGAVFSLFLPADGTLLDRFVAEPELALLNFQGSAMVGFEISMKIALRRGRLRMDLPGNNAAIIDESANLDAAMPEILAGALALSGQRPWAFRRLIVQEDVFPAVAERLLAAYEGLRIGDPADPATQLGPVIADTVAPAYAKVLARVQAEGGDVLFGGQVPEGPGNFLVPALVRAENHWERVQREALLPVLYLMTFRDFNEAIALHNGVPHATAGSLFTTLPERAARFLGAEGSLARYSAINVHPAGGGAALPFGIDSVSAESWRDYMDEQAGNVRWDGPSFLAPPKRRRGRPPKISGQEPA